MEDAHENPLVQARELVKDLLLLASSDYTNDTQLKVLYKRSNFPFLFLTKKLDADAFLTKKLDADASCSSAAIGTRLPEKRNNSRLERELSKLSLRNYHNNSSDVDVVTPLLSARKRPKTISTSSSSSSGATTTERSSSSMSSQSCMIDLTTCDCSDDEFTYPCSKRSKRPQACSRCINSPGAGRVGFSPY